MKHKADLAIKILLPTLLVVVCALAYIYSSPSLAIVSLLLAAGFIVLSLLEICKVLLKNDRHKGQK